MQRFLLILAVGACGGGDGAGLDAPEDCQPGRLSYVHDLTLDGDVTGGGGDLAITNHSFVNASQDQNGNPQLGSLEVGDLGGMSGGPRIKLEFRELVSDGGTVDARGFVKLPQQGIDAGNCETAGFAGRITTITDGWRFTLVDVHASPYCSGAAIAGSFAACIRHQ